MMMRPPRQRLAQTPSHVNASSLTGYIHSSQQGIRIGERVGKPINHRSPQANNKSKTARLIFNFIT